MILNAPVIASLEFYAKIAGMYDNIASISPAFPSPALINNLMAKHMDGTVENVLDVGIGTGLSSEPFVQQGYRITGVDGSREMLELCQKKALASDLVQADFQTQVLPFMRGEFDAAFCANTLYLLTEASQRHIINELHRVTKPGGLYAFNYEPRKAGDLAVRFNDATTDVRNRCLVGTYSIKPENVRHILARHASTLLAADTRVVARKINGYPITFETIVCRNHG